MSCSATEAQAQKIKAVKQRSKKFTKCRTLTISLQCVLTAVCKVFVCLTDFKTCGRLHAKKRGLGSPSVRGLPRALLATEIFKNALDKLADIVYTVTTTIYKR